MLWMMLSVSGIGLYDIMLVYADDLAILAASLNPAGYDRCVKYLLKYTYGTGNNGVQC